MEIPSGKYCDEPTEDEYSPFATGVEPVTCAFFCDACLFPEDQADETTLIRANMEEGYVTAFERCPACLDAYPYGGTVEVKAKEKP